MIDSLSDHLREHCRGHYERVEIRHVEATVEGIAAEREYQAWLAERHGKRQPLPDSLPGGERVYQAWLAERNGHSTVSVESAPTQPDRLTA